MRLRVLLVCHGDLLFADDMFSLSLIEGSLFLLDNGSTHGSRVNKEKIPPKVRRTPPYFGV